MPELKNTQRLNALLNEAVRYSQVNRHEFLTPEHLLLALLHDRPFREALCLYADADELQRQLCEQLEAMEKLPDDADNEPELSAQMMQLLEEACRQVLFSNAQELDTPHLVHELPNLEDSWVAYLLRSSLADNEASFMSSIIDAYGGTPLQDGSGSTEAGQEPWRKLVSCLNESPNSRHPLIGREKEMERTMQVLCRKEKNNPLHVGEPGVGKTALVYGLARLINQGNVPERLRNCRIYQMDLGTMLAGTQYRGDFEKKLKAVMDGVEEEGNAIIYIDEIHNLIGAGRTGEGSLDASNMLKPYLEQGHIRFIGSTTYDEYNRFLARSRGIVRRFQQIDIAEPSIEEAVHILQGLQPMYEEFHHVSYEDEAIRFAVEQSSKYISDRSLPDKAIDLMDEAGAAAQMGHTSPATVGVAEISEVLQKVCKVEASALKEDSNVLLQTLQERILGSIYGQDEAVGQVVQAVQMAKAGLLDEGKPMASLLFVGPTGVGKTEVARVLARELGIQLLRFDMSEYAEKHAVAKLIGSPAGYVGYEDGGLLTDAIRKTPNCVLLFDEIEKAHPDIYNIFLQVMDYACLTDNKGRKADFRNVVLIMTSNAGAQHAGTHIGFDPRMSRGEDMLRQTRRIFRPEFINRLSATIVFHDMDLGMAERILDKKLRLLGEKLATRNVRLTLRPDARQLLLQEGFTTEYGAREMDRVIGQLLKPLLMREILFGQLSGGGTACVGVADGALALIPSSSTLVTP